MNNVYPKIVSISLVCAAQLFFAGCTVNTDAEPVRIYAASSLTTVLPEIAEAYQKQHAGERLEFNFAASSILAKQIEHGVQADIFFSANREWMDYLQKKNLLKPATRMDVFRNSLVLVQPAHATKSLSSVGDLASPGISRIALGDWSHVPAGIYAKSALEKLGLWAAVQPKCIPAVDVRAALTYVERREADCGIVYRTDARLSSKVVIVLEFPKESQPEIIYPVAVMRGSRAKHSLDFIRFLKTPDAEKIARRHGFSLTFETDGKP